MSDKHQNVGKNVVLHSGGTSRRVLLKSVGAVLGGGAASQLLPAAPVMAGTPGTPARDREPEQAVIANDSTAIATTNAGKVVGYIRGGIFTYKGIPYGDTTEGANRFMPARKPKSWEGVRDCRNYGPTAPQIHVEQLAQPERAFCFNNADAPVHASEDCLRINVWTPGLGDGKKRPVMMWLHGGGFDTGSSQGKSTDGENLARHGDVVVVSINHRISALGFMDLSQYGEQFKSAGNVGMLDIVAALEWVRDNIAEFGGDASRVTIFGCSGGAGKVSTLLGMPAARGLFHRAIVESRGDPLNIATPEIAQRCAAQFVAELGITKDTIEKIHTIPVAEILNAGHRAVGKFAPIYTPGIPSSGNGVKGAETGAYPGLHTNTNAAGLPNFGPVIDGVILPVQPQESDVAADVPVIVGSTLNELFTAIDHPEYVQMTEAELDHEVRKVFGEKTPQVIKAFRVRTPDAKPFELWSYIGASYFRENGIKMAKARAARGRAASYVYWFWWLTPIFNGRPGAFHCSQSPFVFCNTDLCDFVTGGGERARAMSRKISDAWISFARSGNPDHPGIPHWKPFSPETMCTMIFDDEVVMVDAPDREAQETIAALGCFDNGGHCA